VGHETDTTIADFVADRRAPTPSAAAEIVAPDRIDVSVRLGIAAGTMESILRQQIRAERESVRASANSMERRVPDVYAQRQRIDDLARRGQQVAEQAHRTVVTSVGGCVWRLRALDPFATLERGYAIVQRGDAIIGAVADVKPGDALDVAAVQHAGGTGVGGRLGEGIESGDV
jgi:exodeoxyribonuclease VII large subunit